MSEIKYGKWFTVPVCSQCKVAISEHEQMYNSGICPHCGFDDRSTVCSTDNIIIRNVYEVRYFFGLIPYRVFIKQESL